MPPSVAVSKVRVLFISDDTSSVDGADVLLQRLGATIDRAAECGRALDLACGFGHEIILLDLAPDAAARAAVSRLRAAGIDLPILMLSAVSSAGARVKAFGVGVDDYLTKPFAADELAARIGALIRRSARFRQQSVVCVGPLRVNLDTRHVSANGFEVCLTGKEYLILEMLVIRPGFTMSKGALFAHLYTGADAPGIKIIDVFVCKLRKKLADTGCGGLITTAWGRGYVLGGPAATARPPASIPVQAVVA